MNKRIHYILSKRDFFSQGDSGRVIHGLGIIEGFVENTWEVNVYSGPGVENFKHRISRFFYDRAVTKYINSRSSVTWLIALAKTVKKHAHAGDTILIRYAVKQQLFLWYFCSVFNRKYTKILEVNSLAYHQKQRLPKLIRSLLIRLEIVTCSRFDIIYVVSDNLKLDLLKYGCRRPIIVMPNGATSNLQQSIVVKQRIFSDRTRLVYLGSLHAYYDFKTVIDGYTSLKKQHPNLSLVFYGNGEEINMIRGLAGSDSDIQLMGSYKNDHLSDIVNHETDILILPYKNIRLAGIGSPTKLFEYMALALPIVASAIGQIPNVINNKENGVLYEAENKVAFANAVASLLDDNILREKVALGAHADFINKHTWKSRVKTFIDEVFQY